MSAIFNSAGNTLNELLYVSHLGDEKYLHNFTSFVGISYKPPPFGNSISFMAIMASTPLVSLKCSVWYYCHW